MDCAKVTKIPTPSSAKRYFPPLTSMRCTKTILRPEMQSRSQRLRSFWSAPRKQDLWANQCQNPANRNLIGYYILPEASLNRRFQNKK